MMIEEKYRTDGDKVGHIQRQGKMRKREGDILFIFYYYFKKRLIYLFLAVPGLSCGMHVGSISPTRDQTRAPCIGSVESYPLDHQPGKSQEGGILDLRGPVCQPLATLTINQLKCGEL